MIWCLERDDLEPRVETRHENGTAEDHLVSRQPDGDQCEAGSQTWLSFARA